MFNHELRGGRAITPKNNDPKEPKPSDFSYIEYSFIIVIE